MMAKPHKNDSKYKQNLEKVNFLNKLKRTTNAKNAIPAPMFGFNRKVTAKHNEAIKTEMQETSCLL